MANYSIIFQQDDRLQAVTKCIWYVKPPTQCF